MVVHHTQGKTSESGSTSPVDPELRGCLPSCFRRWHLVSDLNSEKDHMCQDKKTKHSRRGSTWSKGFKAGENEMR